jgi:hypothetical protein
VGRGVPPSFADDHPISWQQNLLPPKIDVDEPFDETARALER